MVLTLLGVLEGFGQEGSAEEYAVPYPTRSQGPSVQFGQGFQSVAPSMPSPSEGRIKVEPKLESADGVKGREGFGFDFKQRRVDRFVPHGRERDQVSAVTRGGE